MSGTAGSLGSLAIRPGRREDAPAIWRLVRDSGALDLNSPYAYVLLADHFGATCVVAEAGDEVLGFVAAYRPPSRPEAVFVWQVGVSEAARGRGLGLRLLQALLGQPGAADAVELTATVTPSNTASQRLFRALARERGCRCRVLPGHYPAALLGGAHEPEDLFVVGPLHAPQEDA